MADETTPIPEASPSPETVPADAPATVPAAPDPSQTPTQSPEDLTSQFKKDELATAAAVQGVEVPGSATKQVLAEAIVESQGGAQPVVVDNLTKRTDDDTLLGGWLDIVSGEYSGRFGSYVATVTHDKDGYPDNIIVRTRDADNLLVEVAYSDTRPSPRNGGR